MPTPESTRDRVSAALEGLTYAWTAPRDAMPTLALEREHVRAVLERLARGAGFEMSTFVTAIDHQLEEKAHAPRFEVVWQFLSLAHNERLRVTCRVGDGEDVPSCADLWPGASFSERECYDMFGIRFAGHPDLRRLLMPQGYDYHPLRKDFPHQGIEPDRLYREWDRERRKNWNPAS